MRIFYSIADPRAEYEYPGSSIHLRHLGRDPAIWSNVGFLSHDVLEVQNVLELAAEPTAKMSPRRLHLLHLPC